MDEDLLNLVSKRFNSKRVYSPHSIDAFNKLMDLAGYSMIDAPKSYRSKKTELGRNKKYYFDDDQLWDRLTVLIAENKAGNEGNLLHNEINDITSVLVHRGQMSLLDQKSIASALA